MIDLHCHILPGVDDGAADLEVSLQMARASVAQGVIAIACTPHILPGLYNNSGPVIRKATRQLQNVLDQQQIPLLLASGADVHMAPDFVPGLHSGHLLSLADSRYVLVEPPHHAVPPQLEGFFFNVLTAGYIPILTHPERLSWVPARYDAIKRLVRAGVWMQITAGSLTGAFGRNVLYWAERMLEEGYVHLIASDAHDNGRRSPDLAAGRDLAAKRLGGEEAWNLVTVRPSGVLNNKIPSTLPMPIGVANGETGLRVADPSRDGVAMELFGRSSHDSLRGVSRRLRQFFGQHRQLP